MDGGVHRGNRARIGLACLLAACAVPWTPAYGEERYFEALHGWLVVDERGPEDSDAITLDVRWLDGDRRKSTHFPSLIGPLHVSSANRQLFACELGLALEAGNAHLYSLDGTLTFSFAHLAFPRSCGMTPDTKLYWLHYNSMRDGAAWNVVVVLDRAGSVTDREEFQEGRSVTFSFEGQIYSLPIPEAEPPG